MESRKQWKSLEERDDYRENNYWEKDGIPYNPKKFVRRREVERIINAVAYEMKAGLDDKTIKVLEKYMDTVKTEMSVLENLNAEVERRKREI